MNSIEVTTILEDLASKKNKLLSEAAKNIAEYVQTGATGDVHTQVLKMCKGFSVDDTVKILAMTLEYIAKRSSGNSSSPKSGGSFKGGKSPKNSMYGSMGSMYGGSFRGGDY